MLTSAFFTAALAIAAAAYLIGSLSFAVIISRILAKDDVRNHGSGNAGMTNVLRTYGKGPAVLTAVGDFMKAVVSVVLARLVFKRLGIDFIDAGYIAGLFVLLGHVYPLYFGFRGGKGVLTTLGVIFILDPLVFLILAVIFVPVALITRIVSLASVLGAIAFPVLTFAIMRLQGNPALSNTAFSCAFAAIVLIMHRDNIKRLLNGTEHKFGSKK